MMQQSIKILERTIKMEDTKNLNLEGQVQDTYVSIEDILADLGIEDDQDDILTVQDADVIAMACCDKTDGACWTQM